MADGTGPKIGLKYPRKNCDFTHHVLILVDLKILVLVHKTRHGLTHFWPALVAGTV